VEKILQTTVPFHLASRECRSESTIVDVDGVKIGGREFVVIAGPCAVESEEQLLETAWAIQKAGAKILRGGAFKPRASPYSFQGLGREGLRLLAKAREATGLKVVTEVTDPADIGLVSDHADILQIGSRSMSNFALLRKVGRTKKPVLLKRGMAAKIDELLLAAEYVLAGGNPNVILCERGVLGFDAHTRNTLDISCIPVVKELSHLPIIIDPSHAAGSSQYITPLSRAALAVGADGLIIEVHPRPETALCDGKQSITPEHFADLMEEIRALAGPLGRTVR
jgi:3-deoxy-7-phosphoheptulonate synthase